MTQALGTRQSAKWEMGRRRELEQLERYGVYEWVDNVPEGKRVIDTKWVLKEKEEKDPADPGRYKARLTARGFTSQPGVDYDQTYAPVC